MRAEVFTYFTAYVADCTENQLSSFVRDYFSSENCRLGDPPKSSAGSAICITVVPFNLS